jgi:hypothetical protein
MPPNENRTGVRRLSDANLLMPRRKAFVKQTPVPGARSNSGYFFFSFGGAGGAGVVTFPGPKSSGRFPRL